MSTIKAELPDHPTSINRAVNPSLLLNWGYFFSITTLGIWLGAMIFFSFFFAPAAFHVIPSRHLTGTLVTLLLGYLNIGTLMLVPVWMLACGLQRSPTILVQSTLLGLMALSSALSHFWLTPKMAGLRAEMASLMGSIDTTPLEHPLRVTFNSLHHYSVGMMTFNMLATLVLLFFAIRERRA